MKLKKAAVNALKKKLKKLPGGYTERIADKCECSITFVNFVLNGREKDTKGIILTTLDMINEEEEKNNIINNKIING